MPVDLYIRPKQQCPGERPPKNGKSENIWVVVAPGEEGEEESRDPNSGSRAKTKAQPKISPNKCWVEVGVSPSNPYPAQTDKGQQFSGGGGTVGNLGSHAQAKLTESPKCWWWHQGVGVDLDCPSHG